MWRRKRSSFKARHRSGVTLAMIALSILTLSSAFVTAFAAQQTLPTVSTTGIRVIDGTWGDSRLECTIAGFDSEELVIGGETCHAITLAGAPRFQTAGAPALPHLTASIVIPDRGGSVLEILELEYTDFPGLTPEPSKGIITRDTDPATVPYTFGPAYQDQPFPSAPALLDAPYILRDFRGQVVHFQPFLWLPQANILRVFHRIQVAVRAQERSGANEIIRTALPATVDGEFHQVYRRHFINFETNERYTPLDEVGDLLIITHGNYWETMHPLLEWKLQKGIPSQMVDIAEIGYSATQVFNYVQEIYDNQGLTFLLLVGDAEDIPSLTANGGASDPSYSLLAGSDNYPDIFVGRFSGETPDQVATMVERTVEYERDAATATWYHKGMGVASNQGPGDDGEYDNEHVDNIRLDLLAYTYTEVDQIYDPDGTAQMVSDGLNDGRSIINYCGHGSTTSWGSTGFNINNINALVNIDMLPFIQSVACVNGQFVGGTCFAEAWLRATDAGQPTGAISMYASTISQSWSPPMSAQDEIVDLLVQDLKHTYGGLCFNGSMQMMDDYGGDGVEEFLAWTIFGDPTLLVRTDSPAELTVLHDGALLSTLPTYEVTVSGVEGALCALYAEGVFYGSALTDAGGNAVITLLESPTVGAILTLTVTAYNHMVYQGEVSVIPPDGPYVVFDQCYVMDINAQLNPGEEPYLSIVVYNLGVETAYDVTVTLQTGDEFVTLLDAEEFYGDIDPEASATVEAGFQVAVFPEAPDGHVAYFTLTATAGEEFWESGFTLMVYAPQLILNGITILDGEDGILDPGETAGLAITILNEGSGDAEDIGGMLITTDPYIYIIVNSASLPDLAPGEAGEITFSVMVYPETPIGHAAAMQLLLSGDYYEQMEEFFLGIGLIEDGFETGDFSLAPWEMAGVAPWRIDDTEPFEGTYCACSGSVQSDESSALEMQVILSTDDLITFRVRTSSQGGDELTFSVDGEALGAWSGENAWQETDYELTAGPHTLSWIFTRDGSGGGGENCAWLDAVVFPPLGFPPDTAPPVIFHDPLGDSQNWTGPWPVNASIWDPSGLEAELEYRFNDGAWHSRPLAYASGDCSADIPGPTPAGTQIDYRITATDASENLNSVTSETWSFQILEPQDLAYFHDFENGFEDWTIEDWGPGNSWEISIYNGQGNTAYIHYGMPQVEEHAALISPVFDCSNQAILEFGFWHCLRMGFSGSWTLAYVRGSIDGGDTWPIMLAEWDSDEYGDVEIITDELVDITEWAAGEEQVRFMFEYHADYDWYWYLDDICLNGVLMEQPPGIEDLQVIYTPVDDAVMLWWSPQAGADRYNIYQAAAPDGPWEWIATVTYPIFHHQLAGEPGGFFQVTWVSDRVTGQAPASIDPTLGMRPAPPLEK